MKITIESTEKITHLDGVQCRLWKGITESGQHCHIFVHRIAVPEDKSHLELDKELLKKIPPGQFYNLRELL